MDDGEKYCQGSASYQMQAFEDIERKVRKLIGDDDLVSKKLQSLEHRRRVARIVHLDLKGAPLKISYLEKVLLSAKTWGATGILLEWEDTFPYHSELVEIGSLAGCGGDSMYSVDEVSHILGFAKQIGLEAIQLVQTIGHMEFVLKHPSFSHLRELQRSPAVLCPSKEQSLLLVKAMLLQVLAAQPDARYLHIGADEVWHTAVCEMCQSRASSDKHNTASLYLSHIRNTILSIKEQRPELTVLMWDDMIRSFDVNTLKSYGLGDLAEPVVWDYNVVECFNINPNVWQLYRNVFPRVWVGSAFKGANGSCQTLSSVERYVSNQQAWLKEMKTYSAEINFVGIILTGWSRYDHYATLCELMPVSLPSLASCLKFLGNGSDADTSCNDSVVNEMLPSEEWPGEEFARCVHLLIVLRNKCFCFIHGELVQTWLNPWQLEKCYTSPLQLDNVDTTARSFLTELKGLQSQLTTHLQDITGPRSTDEWIKTNVSPTLAQLTEIHATADNRTKSDASVRPK